jgi:hypothetical protein
MCCDPHITTLDEFGYMFNGWGEYTMVEATEHRGLKFVLQARTDLAQTDSGRLTNATVFTAFGAQDSKANIFIQLDPVNRSCELIYVY